MQHAGTYDVNTKVFRPLPDIPGKPVNLGYRVNNEGTMVGAACRGDLNKLIDCTAWIWNGKRYEFFQVPGAQGFGTVATSINDNKEIVGNFDSGAASRSLFRDRRGILPLDLPGYTESVT